MTAPEHDTADTIVATKAALRRRSRAARGDLPADARAHAEAAIHRLLGVAVPRGPLLAYAAAGAEVDLDPWLRELLAEGRALHLPRVAGSGLESVAVRDLDADLAPGWRGLREPRAGLAALGTAGLVAVVVPGVAFDRHGGRLGQGGGHVDRFLAGVDRPRTVVVGVCFEAQMVAAVPREPHDARVDVVVTEQAAYRAG